VALDQAALSESIAGSASPGVVVVVQRWSFCGGEPEAIVGGEAN
jgi:hypothetical protein